MSRRAGCGFDRAGRAAAQRYQRDGIEQQGGYQSCAPHAEINRMAVWRRKHLQQRRRNERNAQRVGAGGTAHLPDGDQRKRQLRRAASNPVPSLLAGFSQASDRAEHECGERQPKECRDFLRQIAHHGEQISALVYIRESQGSEPGIELRVRVAKTCRGTKCHCGDKQ